MTDRESDAIRELLSAMGAEGATIETIPIHLERKGYTRAERRAAMIYLGKDEALIGRSAAKREAKYHKAQLPKPDGGIAHSHKIDRNYFRAGTKIVLDMMKEKSPRVFAEFSEVMNTYRATRALRTLIERDFIERVKTGVYAIKEAEQ